MDRKQKYFILRFLTNGYLFKSYFLFLSKILAIFFPHYLLLLLDPKFEGVTSLNQV